MAKELDVAPSATLVIEASPSGVLAALNAGMHVLAVATPFTLNQLQNMAEIDQRWIVHEPADLPQVLALKIDSINTQAG